MNAKPNSRGLRVAVWVALAYGALLLIWFVTQFFCEPWWVYALNTFAFYLFWPVPLLVLVAALSGNRLVWAVAGLLVAAFAYLYADLLLPPLSLPEPMGATVRVLTWNVLATNDDPGGVVRAIAASEADLVGIQELNPEIAAALGELDVIYPYQLLAPDQAYAGMGILSRYPIQPFDAGLPEDLGWIGMPQVVTFELDEQRVAFVNYHVVSPAAQTIETIMEHAEARDRQARALAGFVESYAGPAIALGDLNTVQPNSAYRIMAAALEDSWREVGWGMGHTFPGGPHRTRVAGIHIPPWLVRIDYVWHTRHWRPNAVEIGPWGGNSDHRPVSATLSLPPVGG